MSEEFVDDIMVAAFTLRELVNAETNLDTMFKAFYHVTMIVGGREHADGILLGPTLGSQMKREKFVNLAKMIDNKLSYSYQFDKRCAARGAIIAYICTGKDSKGTRTYLKSLSGRVVK